MAKVYLLGNEPTSPAVSDVSQMSPIKRALLGAEVGLWDWNLTTNYVWYSPSLLALLGVGRNNFPAVIESWSDRLHSDDYQAVWSALNRQIQQGLPCDIRYRLRVANGTYQWFHTRAIAHGGIKQAPLYYSGSISALAEISGIEESLCELEGHLLQQRKLDAVGVMASGVAHEFNNLLQIIEGYTRFALSSLEPEQSACLDLQHVLTAATQASVLTSRLLNFSHSGKTNAQLHYLDEIVQHFTAMLKPLLPNNISLLLNLNAAGVVVLADYQQLEQAILNICFNAKDAMPDGGDLTIATRLVANDEVMQEWNAHPSENGFVCLSISDTGTGIPEDVQQHIFDPFYTTKSVGEGTGLGLSITFGTIQQINGWIECDSKLQQGTKFHIFLPQQKQTEVLPVVV